MHICQRAEQRPLDLSPERVAAPLGVWRVVTLLALVRSEVAMLRPIHMESQCQGLQLMANEPKMACSPLVGQAVAVPLLPRPGPTTESWRQCAD